jgi:sec-independent protein translocase protein TatB
MFEVGFWELVLISVIALLVVGPEKLPGLLRTGGLWLGRLRRTVAGLQTQLEREFELEEIRKLKQSVDPSQLKQAIEDEIAGPIPDPASASKSSKDPEQAEQAPATPGRDANTSQS